MARSYRYYDAGRQRALQHIEEARQLTAELGGCDEDVKRYFFSLEPTELRQILNAYEQKYGPEARRYAEETLPKWRSGRVTMSGMVAGRLFNLLPPRMPMSSKYTLVENLWRHVGPSSRKRLSIGTDADIGQVVDAVRAHIEAVVIEYQIPETLERRFEWLSAGDVHVKQELLNHLRQMEKSLIVEGARLQAPIMLDHLRNGDGNYTHRIAQVLRIGKHELELSIERYSSGVVLVEPSVVSRASTASSFSWVWWVIVAIVILYFLSK